MIHQMLRARRQLHAEMAFVVGPLFFEGYSDYYCMIGIGRSWGGRRRGGGGRSFFSFFVLDIFCSC